MPTHINFHRYTYDLIAAPQNTVKPILATLY